MTGQHGGSYSQYWLWECIEGIKMASKGRAKGLGFGYNEVTKDINKVSWAKNQETITINDAWRKAKENDPSLEYRMSFVEYKKLYRKNKV